MSKQKKNKLTPKQEAFYLAYIEPPCPPTQQAFSVCIDRPSTTSLRLGSSAPAVMVLAAPAAPNACGPARRAVRVFAPHLRLRHHRPAIF